MKIDINDILSKAELKCKQSMLTYLNEKNSLWILKYCFTHFYANQEAKSFEFIASIKKKMARNSEIENKNIGLIISDSNQGLEVFRCRLPFIPFDAMVEILRSIDKNELYELHLNEFEENPEYKLIFNFEHD